MANPEHVKILKQGVEVWNQWRKNDRYEHKPDLEGADLRKAKLDAADLELANLRYADLQRASLQDANLQAADLRFANLRSAFLNASTLWRADLHLADFRNASLRGVDLWRADVGGANFGGARMGFTRINGVDLSRAEGLRTVEHQAPSSIDTETLRRSLGRIPDAFLRGCGLSDGEVAAVTKPDQPIEFQSCFISYGHSDRRFARRLHDQLQARGVRCWLDEHDLKPGDRLLDVVNNAIRLHDKILLCCSEASLTSWWVRDEIRKAQERERSEGRDIIIPLMVDPYLLDGWEDGLAADLRSRLAADFTGWEQDNAKFEEEFERVVRALRTDGNGRSTQVNRGREP